MVHSPNNDVLLCRWEKPGRVRLVLRPRMAGTFTTRKKPNRKSVSKGKGGRPPAEEVERRAARLRDVAIEVFVEFGYERASLSEIVKRAGASKETLYARYASKQDLFMACIKHYLESHMRPFSDILEEHGSLERNLREFGFRLLTAMLSDGSNSLTLVVLPALRRFPELGRQFWKCTHERGEADLTAFMERQIARGLLLAEDPATMAQHFLYLVTARVILRQILNVEQTLTATQRRKYADQATETFLRAFGV